MPTWDPDAIAANTPVSSDSPVESPSWDPDTHIDNALKGRSFWDYVKGDATSIGRGAGLAARGALEGAESLVTMPLDAGVSAVNLAKRGLNKLGLDDDPTYMELPSQSNDRGLTSLGLPAPQTGGERALTTAAGMLAGARLPQGDMVPQAPGQPLQAAGKTVIPGQTAGQVTGSPALQRVEGILSKLPGGAPIRQAIGTQKENLSNSVQETVDNLAGGRGTTPYSVGTSIDRGIAKGAQDLKDVGGAAFDAVDAKIPSTLQTKLPETQALLNAFTKIDPNAPAVSGLFKDPKVMNIRKAFESDMEVPGTAAKPSSVLGPDGAPAFTIPGTPATTKSALPYQTIKGLITDLSQSIDWSPLNGDAVNGAKKALYGAMRKDLNASASSVSPELGAEVKAANSNWGDTKDRLAALTNAVSGNGGPEQIFNRLVSGAKSGPSGLSQVMAVLSESNQKLLAAGVLQRLGKSSSDSAAFDADTFFRNWGKIDPDAKARLFGSLPQEYSKNLNKLVQNAATLKAYANVMPNPSNSAQVAIWGLGAERAITELLSGNLKSAAIEGVGIPATVNITSRALTNPRVVQYLARQTEPARVLGLAGAAMGASPQSAPAPQSQAQKPLWMQIPGQ